MGKLISYIKTPKGVLFSVAAICTALIVIFDFLGKVTPAVKAASDSICITTGKVKKISGDTATIVAEKKDSCIREAIKDFPEVKEAAKEAKMSSNLVLQIVLQGLSVEKRDRAIDRALLVDTSIKRQDVYKQIYGTNNH
jgi:hypothetical protein